MNPAACAAKISLLAACCSSMKRASRRPLHRHLFELCERLEMQLIIAAPENISPEKGTTYKLVRKVFNNHEHVHVVGLRGFAAPLPEALPGTADAS